MLHSEIYPHIASNGLIPDDDWTQQRQQGRPMPWGCGTLLTHNPPLRIPWQPCWTYNCTALLPNLPSISPSPSLQFDDSPTLSSSISVCSHSYVSESGICFFWVPKLTHWLFILYFADSNTKEHVDIGYHFIKRIWVKAIVEKKCQKKFFEN